METLMTSRRVTRRLFIASLPGAALAARSLKAAQEVPHMPRNAGPPSTFVGKVVAEWLPDGRRMRMVEEFAYFDNEGRRWRAPKGSIVDGASIPRVAWPFIGGPFEGPYREASVIHDVACSEKLTPWLLVHEAFFTAMLASNVPVLKAKVMYGAVYHFGPRWISPLMAMDPKPRAGDDGTGPPQPAATQKNFEELRNTVESGLKGGSMTLEDIQRLFPPQK